MTPFEYALVLLSIVLSLAATDVIMSFHRLMRHRMTVKWDGRVIAAALLVTLEIIRIWFAQWTIRDVELAVTFSVFLAKFIQIVLLVLLAASCLPDEANERYDLSSFYETNRRYFWSLFAAYQLSYFLLWLFVFGGTQSSAAGTVTIMDWLRILVPMFLYALLAMFRRPVLDYAVPVGLIVFYLARYWNQSLAP